jgi:hypothetical protein
MPVLSELKVTHSPVLCPLAALERPSAKKRQRVLQQTSRMTEETAWMVLGWPHSLSAAGQPWQTPTVNPIFYLPAFHKKCGRFGKL